MSAFKGFQQTGGFAATVKPAQLFQGFTDTAFGQLGNIGGVPSTNLVGWLNPSLNITLGTGVSSWVDCIGGNNFTQATGGKQPILNTIQGTYNGRPYLATNIIAGSCLNAGNVFNIGTNSYLDFIIILSTPNTTNNGIMYVASDNGTINARTQGGYAIRQSNTTWQFQYGDSGSLTTLAQLSTVTSNQLTMLWGQIDRVVGKLYLSQDYNFRQTSANIVASITNYTNNNFSVLGNTVNTPQTFNMLDMFIYTGSSALSQSDYFMLRGYMGQLYGF